MYDNLTMDSKILNTERSYPVLYRLHGGGDDQTGWVQFGELMHITDKAIKEGKATPMIIVMPDALGSEEGSKVVY